jgi:hypothetical protein
MQITHVRAVLLFLALVAAVAVPGVGQERVPTEAVANPLMGTVVLDAPFSADAITTVRETIEDGTQVERVGTARLYRDRAGRVRVEQTIAGRDAPAADRQIRVTVWSPLLVASDEMLGTNPPDGPEMVYWLDEATRTARRGPRFAAAITVGGQDTFALPLGGIRFLVFHRHNRSMGAGGLDDAAIERASLGRERVEGIDAVGYRVTRTIPLWPAGNRPIELVDERWESPELKLVISSRSIDPRTGVIEYRLTNIHRTEQPSVLFELPADYTFAPPDPTSLWITLQPRESGRESGRFPGLLGARSEVARASPRQSVGTGMGRIDEARYFLLMRAVTSSRFNWASENDGSSRRASRN